MENESNNLIGAPTGESMAIGGGEKRKRGRPPRGHAKPKKQREDKEKEDEEEDVCFICFDGGSLVLCDRKGCPKAYHPACIKRDEAFFSCNAKWFCGWHICSVCQKASHFMCYTCTYSLCKGCIKDADYFCLRGKKGFCSMCMRTIMLIENKDHGDNKMVQVDFDDKSSWEYLFKMYWVYLKEKLSVTLSELIQAKNPWKESNRIHAREDGSIMARCKLNEKTEAPEASISEKLENRATVVQAVDGSGLKTSIVTRATVKSAPTNISERDEVWHYRDPNGKIQGTFSVIQLRKWNTLGLFPPEMRIWTNDENADSVLLTDAINGLFQEAPKFHGKTSSRSQELGTASDANGAVLCGSSAGTGREWREREVTCHLHSASKDSNGTERMDGLSTPFPQCLDLMNGNNSCSNKPQQSHIAPSSRHGEVHIALLNQERGHDTVKLHSATGHINQDSSGSTMKQITAKYSHNTPTNNSGQNWGSLTSSRSSVNLDSGVASGTNSDDSFEQKGNVNLPSRTSPNPNTSYDDIEAQAAEKLLSLSSGVPLRASDILDWSSSTPKSNGAAKAVQAAENKESAPSKLSVQDSGPSWSSASSLADERDGYSPATKPSAEEDSGLVSVSSLKPTEAVIDNVATPTSVADQLNHSSPSHPVSTLSNWQAAVHEPIEFSTLAEESVSDLLAEVDAMESQTQSGIGSPTSAMRFSEQMIPGYKNFILALFEDLSPTHDPVKSDGLSPNGDIQLPCQSPVTDELVRASQADAFDPLKRSDGNSSNQR